MSAAPLICVTVSGSTLAELRDRRDRATRADLVEVRLDGVRDVDASGAVRGARLPVIVTCRPAWAGGAFSGSEEERESLLTGALDAGACYVDVEWGAPFAERFLADHPDRVVLSHHDYVSVPTDLAGLYDGMRRTGAAIVKIAVTPESVADLVPLLQVAGPREIGRHVLIGMGAAGLPTRILAARFGSAWTYAGDRHEVGQVSAERLIGEFRFQQVSSGTAVYGITGAPLDHSLSPAMHNAAFASTGIDAAYVPCLAKTAEQFFDFAEAIGLRGASVTAPLKKAVARRARPDDEATVATGAANTLRRSDAGWEARNTDVAGLLAPLSGELRPGLRVAVLGCGGAARGAAYALKHHGAVITLHGRRVDAARAVAEELGVAGAGPLPPPRGSWDLLVNATPVGTWPHDEETLLDRDALTGDMVYDLVYNPPVTKLLREAAAAGCRTLNGLEMLVAQAQRQFEWWTGACPSAQVFTDAALAGLATLHGSNAHASVAQPRHVQRGAEAR